MKTICKYAFCLTVVLWCVSCAKNYDINKLDKNITVGGKYFMAPLVSTSQMSLETLLDSADQKKLTVKDGSYYYEMHDTINMEFSVKEIEEKMVSSPKDMAHSESSTTTAMSEHTYFPIVTSSVYKDFSFDFSAAKEKGLVRLDAAGFKDSRLVVSGSWKVGGAGRSGDSIVVELELPSGYVTESGNNKKTLSMSCDGEGNYSGSCSITRFAFGKSTDMKYDHQLKINSAKAYLEKSMEASQSYSFTLNAIIGSGEDGTGLLNPEVVYGLVNVSVSPHQKSLPIEDVPSIMQDAVLDLQKPVILMDFASNAGIPFDANIKYTYRSDVEGKSGTHERCLFVNATDTKGVVDSTRYYLTDEKDEAFEKEGYSFQEFPLKDCFYMIPDEIVLEATPAMNLTVPQHIVWFDDYKYDVKGDVTVSLPFLFGKDLWMTVVQTFSGLPELVGSTAQNNDITILGLFENNYPQNFIVQAELRDSMDRPIDGGLSTASTARCSMDGEVVKDTIFLNFTHCIDAINASMIKLNIHLTGSEAGRCIDSTDYLQLNLKLSTQEYGKDEKNGGITIDLDNAK